MHFLSLYSKTYGFKKQPLNQSYPPVFLPPRGCAHDILYGSSTPHPVVVLLFPECFLLSDSVPSYCDSIWIEESVWLDTEGIHTSEMFSTHKPAP